MVRSEHSHFERLRGRKGPLLKEFDQIVIIELRTDETYAGVIDEYYYDHGGFLALVSCKLLDREHHRWVEHDIVMMKEGKKTIRDPMPTFRLSEIKDIFVLSKNLRDRFSAEDTLQLYIDPHHRALPTVKCEWRPGGEHTSDCDSSLHEALALLYSEATLDDKYREQNKERTEESFRRVRQRLIMGGARIP